MKQVLLIALTVLLFSFNGKASHALGGDITWTCQGGDYVFQLVFYRDCNGAEVNTLSVNLDVWNHPTISQITLDFISRTDLSPICTEVAGGPTALDCGTGANAGNGVGAIEKVVYRSAPITLNGTPPAQGWIFTFSSFSRSNALTNLSSPSTVGLTISAKMFPIPGGGLGCVDNSPQFLQEPYFVSCVGDPYEYNMNAVDPDLDSLFISFGIPYDTISLSPAYNPPTVPAPVQFEPGFSYTSPTPGPSMNPGNVAAQIDPSSGNLTFLSNTIGNFNVKILARSFRDGILIAEVEREMQLIVSNCAGNNNAPVISGPFGGLFETTVTAGTTVNFTLNSSDVELLQDGSPQSNILTASGPMFGTNFTSTSGCAIAPCATLNTSPPITMSQGVSTDFSWQTSCDHLVNANGNAAETIPYHFVFKVQDDHCPVPKVKYATITINVVNPGIIEAPDLNCIQSDGAGNLVFSWNPVTDPFGTFDSYEIHSVQNGIEGSSGIIASGTMTVPGAAQQNDYFLVVNSGCNGNTWRSSDTISNIFLDLSNPGNGTAVLDWNDPIAPALPTMNSYYHVYREYPSGTWTLLDSVPYGVTNYLDTIDICSAFLNYQVILPNEPCDFTSNIEGDNFEDMTTPDIPVINYVTVDTLSGDVVINWNENYQPDTYGYIVYVEDNNGFIVELDTVWGLTNTSYSYSTNIDGPLTYSVAAFDSCLTTSFPATYQTSAKAELHTTMFLSSSLNICDRSVNLSWNAYFGWAVDEYRIYGRKNSGGWFFAGSTNGLTLSIDVEPEANYCFVVEAISTNGVNSFSAEECLNISTPQKPAFNYLQVATVEDEKVRIQYYIDNSTNISAVSIQRLNPSGIFEEIVVLPASSTSLGYIDSNVNVHERFYTYRAQIIDSCGNLSDISNEAQTILLRVENDEVRKVNYLNWTPYHLFDGSILGYSIYRGINGVFDPNPIANVGSGQFSYTDSVLNVISTGRICYKVQAIESMNSFGFSERSTSNEECVVLPPIIYVPNAFFPEGVNKVFYPVLSDFDPQEYEFIIFDRWGYELFKTNDPYEGWTGLIQSTGHMATPGTYLYMIIFTDGNGEQVVTRGHVSLIQ